MYPTVERRGETPDLSLNTVKLEARLICVSKSIHERIEVCTHLFEDFNWHLRHTASDVTRRPFKQGLM